jgi:glucokinase
MARLLAGDIGGTKTILRLNEIRGDCGTTLAEQTYVSKHYPHLNAIVAEFLSTISGDGPQAACLAVAGPVVSNSSFPTNLSWQLDGEEMAATLKIPQVQLINDFAAVGYGVLALEPEDICVLQDKPALTHEPIAVLGAGTGLGEALLVWQQYQYQVLPLEGGHSDFAARNADEIGLLEHLLTQHHRVSVERVVSGQGIAAIYGFLRQSKTAPPESAEVAAALAQPGADVGAIVSHFALENQDPLCERTLEMFVAAYGAEAGNLALKSLPFGGVFIAGGIGAKILPKMQDGRFMENFLDKGRMRKILEDMPVSLVLNPKVGLIGAALIAERLHRQV